MYELEEKIRRKQSLGIEKSNIFKKNKEKKQTSAGIRTSSASMDSFG
jgi:hypothetical protein